MSAALASQSPGVRAASSTLACASLLLGIAVIGAPAHAFVKVNGTFYAYAKDQGSTQPNSQFMTDWAYRFDFEISDWNTASANTNSLSQWGPSPSSRIFNYFTIRQCNNGDLVDCTLPVTTAVTTGSWNSSPSVTDQQQFVAYAPTGTFPSRPVDLKLGFGASSGQTGLLSKISGVDTAISSVMIGDFGVPMLSPLAVNPAGSGTTWKQIGATVNGSTISSFTASNIIRNLNLSFTATRAFFPVQDGMDSDCGASAADVCQLAIKFNGISSPVLFNINSMYLKAAPGPLPLIGALSAFAYTRKLRNRIKAA